MTPYKLLKHHEQAHEDAIWSVCWVSPTKLVTGSLDSTAKIWNLAQDDDGSSRLEELCVLDGHALGVVSIAKSPVSNIIATSALDCRIRLFDLDKPIEEAQLFTIDAGPVESWTIKFSHDGKYIATGTRSGMVRLYNASPEGDRLKAEFQASKFAFAVDFSSDGRYVACGNVDGWVKIFDLKSEELTSTIIEAHAMPIRTIAFSPDSKYLLTGSDDKQIKVHLMENRTQIKTLTGHGSYIQEICFSPNGDHFASASTDKKVKVWDMKTYECIQTFTQHTNRVTGVGFTPDGTRFASVSEDMSIAIYDKIDDSINDQSMEQHQDE